MNKRCFYFSLPYGFVVQPDTTLKVVNAVKMNIQPFNADSNNVVTVASFTAGNNKELYYF